jgi:hypothetical protein
MGELEQLVQIMKTEGDAAPPQPLDRIERAEKALGFQLPPDFRSFTSEVGSAGVFGIEIYGVLSDDFENGSVPDAIWLTLTERRDCALVDTAVVVAADGMGGYYILDTAKADERGEPPVEVWVPGLTEANSPREVVGADFASTFLAMVLEQRDAL